MGVETFRLSDQILFRAPGNSVVQGGDVRVRLDREGVRVVDVWLILTLSPSDWAAVDTHGWFHLPSDVRGPTFGGTFDPDAEVRVEARLASDIATALALLSDDEWTLLAELRGARTLRGLHDTESWFGLHVTQQRGPVRGGFRTRHAG